MKLTYRDLVQRLYDLERLATPPLAGEAAGCMSSYDRRSRYNAETGCYEEWDANHDGSGFVRYEAEGNDPEAWMVVFEQQGPGVLWRVWSALPQDGRMQIFIDDQPDPVVDQPFRAFFERFNTDIPPLNFPNLAPTLSRGRNRFIPIPYQQTCKIRFGRGWGAYYHFTYSRFAAGSEVPSFTGSFDRDACLALAEADRLLSQRGWRMPRSRDDTLEQIQVTIPAGEQITAATLLGNRAISGLRISLDLPEPPADQIILRELTMSITWDDDPQPSVWSPLGDFFGSAPGVNYYRGLPLGVTDAGFYCHWFMPFAERAQIAFANDGNEARTLTLTIAHRPLAQPATTLLRFHAKWHRDALWEQTQAQGRAIDWPILLTNGCGRFCGMSLHVWNHWQEPSQPADTWWYGTWDRKSIDWWWGEGDEKFFVDGEPFPSTFGTGSEDYIGYAWAAEPPFPTFESAYASQPRIPLNANGHTAVNRFQICDDVPFQHAFEASIERYKPNSWGEQNESRYAVVAYWYQQAGEIDPYQIIPVAERVSHDVTLV